MNRIREQHPFHFDDVTMYRFNVRTQSLLEVDLSHLFLHADYFDLVPQFVGQPDGLRNRLEQNNRRR